MRPHPAVEHLQLEVDGLRFYVAACGPANGPLVVLLHGFPEMSYGWRHQIGPLAAAGCRVVAPDQRGYGHSDKPRGRDAYRLDRLVQDVLGLAHVLGHERFSVCGHDWGGVVAWQLAARHAPHIERAAILNAPHPATVWRHVVTSPVQALRSWYIGFFQLPMLPEAALSAGQYTWLRNALVRSSRPGTFRAEELAVYCEAWAQEGALTGMLNWYRAAALGSATPPQRIGLPVRILWGDRDAFLDASLAEEGASMCADAHVLHLPRATHWLHHEEAARVNQELIGFFA